MGYVEIDVSLLAAVATRRASGPADQGAQQALIYQLREKLDKTKGCNIEFQGFHKLQNSGAVMGSQAHAQDPHSLPTGLSSRTAPALSRSSPG
jgi:hypothetical protein